MMAKAKYFNDIRVFELLKKERNPHNCRKLGREVTPFDAGEWALVRFDIMTAVLEKKFADPVLRGTLLHTGSTVLAEASPTDRVWGIGLTMQQAHNGMPWRGQNLLGDALTRVRTLASMEKGI